MSEQNSNATGAAAAKWAPRLLFLVLVASTATLAISFEAARSVRALARAHNEMVEPQEQAYIEARWQSADGEILIRTFWHEGTTAEVVALHRARVDAAKTEFPPITE